MATQHPEQCSVCEFLTNNPELTNVEAGRQVGVDEATVRRHKRHINPNVTADIDPVFGVPKSAILTRGRSILTEHGWEKATWAPHRAELLNYDDMAAAIDGYNPPMAPIASISPFAEVFGAADFQIGKAMETGGGTKETVQRVMASTHAFKRRVELSRPEAIVITDLGDVIENIWNVPNHQLTTNDMDVMTQMRTARRLYLEIFKTLAPLAPHVYSVAVPSNHGQVRTAPGSSVGSVDNDFGLEISHQIEDVFSEHESQALRRIRFVRPDQYQETAVLDVCGTRNAFNHGHRTSGGVRSHDKWWSLQDHGRMPGWDAQIMTVAHYHSAFIEQSGDGRWIIGVSASEPSSDYFALSTGKRSKRGVTCYRIENGVWSDLEIL